MTTAIPASAAVPVNKQPVNWRRGLLIVGFCAVPVILLYAMYVLHSNAQLSLTTLGVPIGLFAAFAAAHVAIRFLAPGADPAILPIVFALSGVGITFLTRLSPEGAVNQVIWLFLSVAAMVARIARPEQRILLWPANDSPAYYRAAGVQLVSSTFS